MGSISEKRVAAFRIVVSDFRPSSFSAEFALARAFFRETFFSGSASSTSRTRDRFEGAAALGLDSSLQCEADLPARFREVSLDCVALIDEADGTTFDFAVFDDLRDFLRDTGISSSTGFPSSVGSCDSRVERLGA